MSVYAYGIKNLSFFFFLQVSVLLQECLCKRDDFKEFCRKFLLQNKYNLAELLPLSSKSFKEDPLKLIQLVTGYEQIVSCEILSFDQSSAILTSSLTDNLLDSVVNISAAKDDVTNKKMLCGPILMTLAERMLSLSYAVGLKVSFLIFIFYYF